MATLRQQLRHADHPPSPSPLRRTTVIAALLAGVLLATPTTGTAHAVPGDGVADPWSAHTAAAAQVAAVQARLTEAEDTLERMTIEAEAASGAALAAQAALAAAQDEATATAWELAAVRGKVDRTQDHVADLGRETYMGSNETFGDVTLLLDADSPTEVLQQAATLEALGEKRSQQLEVLKTVEAEEARADRAARVAVARRDRAARAAADAAAVADAQLAAAQGTFDALTAEKAALEAELRESEIRLLELRGAADPIAAWAQQQAAERERTLLTAAGGAIAPTTGRITSCYGARWGTLHAGVDIAAPIGTPVFTPEDGIVLDAGPASGFGLAIYVQHRDGAVTLYGHVNRFFVSPGEVVRAGDQIAEVGNRGQSTGPHLHFEVHTGGLYGNRVNPTQWLGQRGITLNGC